MQIFKIIDKTNLKIKTQQESFIENKMESAKWKSQTFEHK